MSEDDNQPPIDPAQRLRELEKRREERKEKHRAMEQEREKMRQAIRDKVGKTRKTFYSFNNAVTFKILLQIDSLPLKCLTKILFILNQKLIYQNYILLI